MHRQSGVGVELSLVFARCVAVIGSGQWIIIEPGESGKGLVIARDIFLSNIAAMIYI